ncbi:MAG TPA: hypothetical protein VGG48_12150 [Rhizomicrobium sp.]|jgi:hypothetical protein
MPLPIFLAIAAGLAAPAVHKRATTHAVDFKTKKKVKKPVKVGFKTKDGRAVAFKARKEVTEEKKVHFRAKNK